MPPDEIQSHDVVLRSLEAIRPRESDNTMVEKYNALAVRLRNLPRQ